MDRWNTLLRVLLATGFAGVTLAYAGVKDQLAPRTPYPGSLDALSGYQLADNQAPDTVAYSWIELRGDAGATWINDISNHDDGWSAARYPIGFNFPFFGAVHDSFRVAVNGFVQFTTATGSLSNAALPATNIAGPAICAHWDDQHLDRVITGGVNVIGYKNFGAYTVIEYDSTGIYSTSCTAPNNRLKYEVILFNDGKIKLQYNIIDVCNAADSSMTVGIQSNGSAGSAALQYCFGNGTTLTGPLPVSGRTVWFFPSIVNANDFAIEAITAPATGSYLPGEALSVSARIRNLGTSTQSATVRYRFNDGATVSETTAALAQYASEEHTFVTDITLPAVNGAYVLTVWSELPTDEYPANDTARVTISVFAGGSCASAIELNTAGPDSATWNNCGAGNNDPGVPCYATSYNDMLFRKDVAPGNTATFWISSLAWTSKYLDIAARWGGSCPGANTIDCFTASSTLNLNKRLTWTNSTGVTQTVYITVGNYSSGSANYCGNFKLAWQEQTCAAVEAPYSQGFETVPYVPVLPNCMTQENGNGVSPVWESYAALPRTGTKCATISSTAAGNDDWLFTPGINMEEGRDYLVSYWRRVGSANYLDSLEVKAGLAPTAAAMTITVAAMDSCMMTVYTQKLGSFSCSASGVYYLGWHNASKTASARTYIDDISIESSVPGCSAGTVTIISQTAADSVTLTANLGGIWYGGIPRYQWYSGMNCQTGVFIPGATTSSYTSYASGVFSCRVYVLDSTTCAACDSAFATVIDCAVPIALPLAEGFESAPPPALPFCWTQTDENGDGRYWKSSTNSPRSGSRSAYCQYSTGTAADDWLFSQAISLAQNRNYAVDYYYRQYLSGYTDALEVWLGTEADPAAMTIVIDSLFTFNSTVWVQHNPVFTAPATATYFIGWHCVSGINQGGVLLDDVTIYAESGPCYPPNLHVPAVAAYDTVILTANASGGFGGPIQYQWFTGPMCAPSELIPGATDSAYRTINSGVFSCKVWREGSDADICAACDSAYATVLPCATADSLVISVSGEENAQVQLCFYAPLGGSYSVYSTTVPNNDGDPRNADPQWTLETALTVTEAGLVIWTDPAALVTYKNYAVVHDCTPARSTNR